MGENGVFLKPETRNLQLVTVLLHAPVPGVIEQPSGEDDLNISLAQGVRNLEGCSARPIFDSQGLGDFQVLV